MVAELDPALNGAVEGKQTVAVMLRDASGQAIAFDPAAWDGVVDRNGDPARNETVRALGLELNF